MAQYKIDRACGHVETIQIYGTDVHGERKRTADYEATRSCAECYAVTRDARREVEAATAAVAAQERGLPALTGSPKQIVWAERIRAEVLAAHADAMTERAAVPNAGPASAARQSWWIATTAEILARPAEAKWWIDNRDTRWVKLAKALMTTEEQGTYEALVAAANAEVTAAM
jgi:hypothetical protein